jgi:hypothetical protein
MSEFIEECKGLLDEYGDHEVEDDGGRPVDIEYWYDDQTQCYVVV